MITRGRLSPGQHPRAAAFPLLGHDRAVETVQVLVEDSQAGPGSPGRAGIPGPSS